MRETLPGYGAWRTASPSYLEGYPDETCAGGNHDLSDEGVVKLKGLYFCAACAEPSVRCDVCGYYGCRCP